MKTGALVAAAGLSSRMNCFKPLLPLGDSTLLRYGLRTLLTAGAFPVAVVTGREEAVIRASLDDLPVTCLYNPEYAACQMLRSCVQRRYHSAVDGLRRPAVPSHISRQARSSGADLRWPYPCNSIL